MTIVWLTILVLGFCSGIILGWCLYRDYGPQDETECIRPHKFDYFPRKKGEW